MKLTPTNKLPDADFRSEYKNNATLCREFLNMNTKYAKVIMSPYDYKSVHSAYTSLRKFIHNHNHDYGSIYVKVINEDLYFIRTDMEASDE